MGGSAGHEREEPLELLRRAVADLEGDPSLAPGSGRSGAALQLPRVLRQALALTWRAGRHEVLVTVVLQVLTGVAVFGQLLLGKVVIGAVTGDGSVDNLSDVAPELLCIGLLAAAGAAASVAVAQQQLVLAELVERQVQGRIVDAVAEVDLEAFETPEFHDRLARATWHASERSWQVSYSVVGLVTASVGMVAVGGVVVRYQAWLLPLVVVAYLPLAWASSRNGRATFRFAHDTTPEERERSYLAGVLLGRAEAKELRMFGAQAVLRRRYDDLYDARLRALRALARRRARRSLVANLLATSVTVAGVALVLHLAITDRVSVAEAAVTALALQQLGSRLRSLDSNASVLQECGHFLDDVIRFLDAPAGGRHVVDHQHSADATDRGAGGVAVEEVRFAYPGTDREVLRGVSVEVRPGELVALVGANGSGKTTLAKIVCGLYHPTSGVVRWEPGPGRPRCTAIFQDFVHYELSAQENIGLGDPMRVADLAAIRGAAAAAGIDGRLADLELGYATRLSRAYEHGAELSMGEWQRVALARALFREADFVVLDEPTSALDALAEAELLAALRAFPAGRGALLISHRMSSVRGADRIYVLHDGEVVELGDHEALMARGGRYAEMFQAQASAYGEPTGDDPR